MHLKNPLIFIIAVLLFLIPKYYKITDIFQFGDISILAI